MSAAVDLEFEDLERADEREMLLQIAESVEEAVEDWDRDLGLISRVAGRLRREAAELGGVL